MGAKPVKSSAVFHSQNSREETWTEKKPFFPCSPEQRDVNRLADPLEDIDAYEKPEPYYLRWLEGSRVTTCYGCANKFRPSMNDSPPPEPYDVVLCRKQVRAYTPKGSVGLRFTLKPENVFFHLKRSCVEMNPRDKLGMGNLLLKAYPDSWQDVLKVYLSI